jgi:hypothetical protein
MLQIIHDLSTDCVACCFHDMSKCLTKITVIPPSMGRSIEQNSNRTFKDFLDVVTSRLM